MQHNKRQKRQKEIEYCNSEGLGNSSYENGTSFSMGLLSFSSSVSKEGEKLQNIYKVFLPKSWALQIICNAIRKENISFSIFMLEREKHSFHNELRRFSQDFSNAARATNKKKTIFERNYYSRSQKCRKIHLLGISISLSWANCTQSDSLVFTEPLPT